MNRSVDLRVWGTPDEVRTALREIRARLRRREPVENMLPALAALALPGPRRGRLFFWRRHCRDCGERVGILEYRLGGLGHFDYVHCPCGWLWAKAYFKAK